MIRVLTLSSRCPHRSGSLLLSPCPILVGTGFTFRKQAMEHETMNARSKMFSILGLSLALAGAAWAGDKDAKDSKKTAKVGEAAPAFELKDTKGTTHKLSDFAGKTVVLEWFNPDCPFCQGVYSN